MNHSNTLTLQILNNDSLASGKHGNTLIGSQGATIGSNPDNFWSIQNQKGQIEPLHAKVDMVDSHFCISAYAPDLYLNDVDLFAKAKPVRLQHGDILKLSDFKIKVQVNPDDIFRTRYPCALKISSLITMTPLMKFSPENRVHPQVI
ncbi:hypothetical protein I2494_07605 [Budviciaceae bacterium BWR-B9]|uniref:FHA domain-containing protein n=1 Tax=Limnobaculum allomyrinae TaxID=2791986 RepID=A0ABS1IPA2_9GAMM|nr:MULTISPECIES: hypothetical protein [Limnobaculum]MBK5143580.1 hypothetical protein [Limnobaculum allomyrinae]MBV7691468.1 hypothetical protein [Limnobaculum sp. M2-1]